MSKTRIDILEKKDYITKCIEENVPKASICKELHCKPETLNFYLDKMNLVYLGNQNRSGMYHYEGRVNVLDQIERYKEGKIKVLTSHSLKKALIRDGIKEHKCEICGFTEWNGKEIPLELHHINENHYDNVLENLQLLCPNCHAQCNNKK